MIKSSELVGWFVRDARFCDFSKTTSPILFPCILIRIFSTCAKRHY